MLPGISIGFPFNDANVNTSAFVVLSRRKKLKNIRNMSCREPLTVSIYAEEATLISNWTLQYPTIETGGDLFGLWESESNVVVQLVLGPGKKSRRTRTSFFQDEEYLSQVGGSLTTREGLCNVGAWHSHHSLNLPGPSNGDAETIWRNLPTPGRFLLLIASIEIRGDGRPKIEMTFSLFDSGGEKKKMLRMKCKILEGNSPLRAKPEIKRMLCSGAEVTEDTATKQARRNDGERSERKTCEGGGSHSEKQWSDFTSEKHRKRNGRILRAVPPQQNPSNSTSRKHPTTDDNYSHKGDNGNGRSDVQRAARLPQNSRKSTSRRHPTTDYPHRYKREDHYETNRNDSFEDGCCVIL